MIHTEIIHFLTILSGICLYHLHYKSSYCITHFFSCINLKIKNALLQYGCTKLNTRSELLHHTDQPSWKYITLEISYATKFHNCIFSPSHDLFYL